MRKRIEQNVKSLANLSLKDLFASFVVYEMGLTIDNELIEILEGVYEEYMDNDSITSLLNDDIREMVEDAIIKNNDKEIE